MYIHTYIQTYIYIYIYCSDVNIYIWTMVFGLWTMCPPRPRTRLLAQPWIGPAKVLPCSSALVLPCSGASVLPNGSHAPVLRCCSISTISPRKMR